MNEVEIKSKQQHRQDLRDIVTIQDSLIENLYQKIDNARRVKSIASSKLELIDNQEKCEQCKCVHNNTVFCKDCFVKTLIIDNLNKFEEIV